MAEDMPQDPSRPQETSRDSGVIVEVQSSNSTGKSVAVQSNQNSQAPTTQNNQNNKKYDLGILFVHGIGKQCRGETFKGMYYPIIDELKSQNISVNEVSINDNSAITVVSRDNLSKSILFQESHWNNFQPGGQKKRGGGLVSKLKALCAWIANVVQCIFWIVYFLGFSAIEKMSGKKVITFATLLCAVYSFSLFMNILKSLFVWITNVVQCIFWIIYFLSLSAIEKMSGKKLTTFATMLSIAYLFLFFTNVFKKNTNVGELSAFDEIVRVSVLLIYFSLIFYLPKLQESNPWELFRRIFSRDALKILIVPTVIFVIIPVLYAYRNDIYRIISNPSVAPFFIVASILVVVLLIVLFCIYCADYVAYLWNQINVSAEYVSSGEENVYIEKVKGHIYNLAKKSDKVVIIAHSMGEYLSYNSLGILERKLSGKKIHLVSIGGGQGLVSLAGNLKKTTSNGKISDLWSIVLAGFSAASAFILAVLLFFAWIGIAIDLWRFYAQWAHGHDLIKFINSPLENYYFIIETQFWILNIGIHLILLLLLLAIKLDYSRFFKIQEDYLKSFEFYRYSHLWDPVGNSAVFFYGNKVESSIVPSGVLGHGVTSYFGEVNAVVSNRLRDVNRYVRKRIVQHISSLAFDNSKYLFKKYSDKPYIFLSALILGELATLMGIFGYRDILTIVSVGMLVLIPNLLGSALLIWMQKTGTILRDPGVDPWSWKSDLVFNLLFGFIISVSITFMSIMVVGIFL